MFFNSPRGKTDPQAELEATIDAFFSPAVVETEALQHPQCQFPARFAWLDQQLELRAAGVEVQPCARFEWWRSRLAAHSISLVFASAYLNNPASMFGHTFLRLNRKNRGPGSDLVAYGVNYAANPTTENAFLYAFLGLTGGFPGTYSTMPYYLKVKEYTSLEHRALWEYDLDFSESEVTRLVQHLWELGHIYFDYFYLDENCSYHLLSLLEAARPSLALTKQFPGYAIPADTLRAVLREKGLTGERRFRPSQYATMIARRAELDGEERDEAYALAEGTSTTARSAAVLDAAIELARYRAGDAPEAEEKKREQALLSARGKMRVPSKDIELEPASPPELGHSTAMISAGGGHDREGPYYLMESRFALHDLYAASAGYVRGSQIEFLRAAVRVPLKPERGFAPAIDGLRVLRIVSLAPLDAWAFRWSWRLSTGLERLAEAPPPGRSPLYYQLSGGPGLSFAFDRESRYTTYLFLDGRGGLGPAFERRWELTGGASFGFLFELAAPLRIAAEAGWLYRDRYRIGGTLALDLHRDLELRLEASKGRDYESYRGALLFYF